MNAKEQYWKYSLIVLILFLGIILFREFWPYLSGFLGAFTIYILVRKQMFRLTEKRKIKTSIAAIIILIEVILCLLIPTFLVVWLLVSKVQSIDLNPNSLISTIQHFISLLREKTGYDVLSTDNISTMTSFITKFAQMFIGQLSSFIINCIVLVFVLYFMLISNRQMEDYLYGLLPFSNSNKKEVVHEIKIMVRANAIGIPLLALIQGIIATIGYIIFGAPDPVLFGFITCFATIIPLLGTSLVWFPLALYLVLTGNWLMGIGLAVYALAVISNVDNLIRFVLQKKLANTHPLITVFGVIIGLTLFGFWGVIFGPLLLSMFLLCLNMFKKEYLDTNKE
ncbi:MAG: AI-2E family transporter [Dysgonomonas sp.]